MSPDAPPPVLELDRARPAPGMAWADAAVEAELPAIDLRLGPGQVALIEAPDQRWCRALAALCAGLPPLAAGRARFLGQDWAALRRPQAEALRGRIGHVSAASGGWLPHLDVGEGILLPQLHHGRRPEAALREAAAAVARRFGLDGLPQGHPAELPALDLVRAACVRAFLGEPMLLLLERPSRRGLWTKELTRPFLEALAEARRRGAACVWLSARPSAAGAATGLQGARHYRLSAQGLQAASGAAGRVAA